MCRVAGALGREALFDRSPVQPFPARALSLRLQYGVVRPPWATFMRPGAPLEASFGVVERPDCLSVEADTCPRSLATPNPRYRRAANSDSSGCAGSDSDREVPSDVHELVMEATPRPGRPGSVKPSTTSVAGNIWCLSKDPDGCRLVQQAFDEATSEVARAALAVELHSHAWEALRCPNANHVLQKVITTAGPPVIQFIVDELFTDDIATFNAARHRYGCRIVQRFLERGSANQVAGLTESLLSKALPLCTHPFGNYVMQHLLEHGTKEHKHRLSKALEWQVSVVNVDSYTSAVLRKALCHSSAEDQRSLVRAVIATPGLVVSLACSRHGSAAVQHMLQEMQGDDQTEIQRQLMAQVAVLRSSRYGRCVQHHLPLDLEPGA